MECWSGDDLSWILERNRFLYITEILEFLNFLVLYWQVQNQRWCYGFLEMEELKGGNFNTRYMYGVLTKSGVDEAGYEAFPWKKPIMKTSLI